MVTRKHETVTMYRLLSLMPMFPLWETKQMIAGLLNFASERRRGARAQATRGLNELQASDVNNDKIMLVFEKTDQIANNVADVLS